MSNPCSVWIFFWPMFAAAGFWIVMLFLALWAMAKYEWKCSWRETYHRLWNDK